MESPISPRRYCEDCRFYMRALSGLTFSKCGSPKAERTNTDRYVARDLDQPPYCSTMRISQCGPDAAWFEPKSADAVAA